MTRVLFSCSALVLLLLCSPPVQAEPSSSGGMQAAQWPLRPRPAVVRVFDPPATRWGAGHRGVDLAGRVGQRVRAALPGRVGFAGRVAGVGVVVVDHGGRRTTYQPVSVSVSRGEEVHAGEVLGRLEWPGSHCLPSVCLHWGLLEGERYLDPLSLVGAEPRPVRLLPLGTSLFLGPLAIGPSIGGPNPVGLSALSASRGGRATAT